MFSMMLFFFNLMLAFAISTDITHHPGHLKPFGSHGIDHAVIEMEGFPTPDHFIENHIKLQKPLRMVGAAKHHPAYHKWTDDYLVATYGQIDLGIEPKKEHRTMKKTSSPLKEFIETYETKNVYSISSINEVIELRRDILVPCPIQCEGLRENFVQASLWFSNGGTKGSFHQDTVENIICLFRGIKTFTLIDYDKYKSTVDYSEHPYLDVESVDFTIFPWMAEVELYQVNLTAGDCLYIPYLWYHQVNSYGNNLAVSQQWKHEVTFNPDTYSRCRRECDPDFTADTVNFMGYLKLDELPDMVRDRLDSMLLLDDAVDRDELLDMFFAPEKEELMKDELIRAYPDQFIEIVDINKDGYITKEDVDGLNDETLVYLGKISNNVFNKVEMKQKSIWHVRKAGPQKDHTEF